MTLAPGHRVLVIGGSGGIGRALAALCVASGAHVSLASRSIDRLREAQLATGAHEVIVCDARARGDVEALFAQRDSFDHIVVTAAELDIGPLRAQTPAQVDDALTSKFLSAVHVAQLCRIVEGGSLTLVSGMLGVRPSGKATLLSAINAALNALAKGLALEMAPTRVNCISPGRVDSSWWDKTPADVKARIFHETGSRLPVGRVGKPEEIAAMIHAVIANPFMSGAVIQVDGGNQLV